MNCGCTPTKEDIINRNADKDISTEEVKNTTQVTKTKEEDEPCSLDCTNSCLDKASTKSETVNCFVDCGCYPGFSAIELMSTPEASIISHQSSGTVGYFLLAIFLIGVVVLTGYLVVEREDKEKKRPLVRDQEEVENVAYQKID